MHVTFLDLTPSPSLRSQLDDAYNEVMSSGSYLRGKYVERLEEEWAGYVGTRHCIAVQSGSEALRLLVQLWKHGNGDWGSNREWDVRVPWNSIPTINALRGMTEILPNPIDLDCNFAILARTLSSIYIPVHLYGNPADMGQFEGIDAVFEDACQAHGAKYKGKMCGSLAKAAAWSFYPTKNLGAYGDAGAITTDDDQIAADLREMRSVRMDALQAAFLSVKLPYLNGWNERRRQIAMRYKERLEGIECPLVNQGAEPNWHLFVILHPHRDALAQRLRDEWGVETMVHYPVDKQVLSLPCNPNLTDAEVDYVIEAVNRCSVS